jgi:hypothetical protein
MQLVVYSSTANTSRDVTVIYFALIGWKTFNWVTTGDKF